MNELFAKRYLQLDFAREMNFNRIAIEQLLMVMERLNYTGLALYLEGAFEFSIFPGTIRPAVMSEYDVNWLIDKASKHKINLLPMTNLVGHMEHFVNQERFDHLRKGYYNQLDITNASAEKFAIDIANEFINCFQTDIIHIGGDEVKFDNTQDRILYAKFLSNICNKLINKGVRPCIWGDMIWRNKELADFFPKDVVIFDWYYYGHRRESLKFWKQAGFKEIYSCPCEQGWRGFINSQTVPGKLNIDINGQLKPEVDIDEVEAFLKDAVEEGVNNGILTTWENYIGNFLWSQMVPIARAALYMSGKQVKGTDYEEDVENALFGRITPYTRITKLIQQHIQSRINRLEDVLFHPCIPKSAVYERASLITLIQESPKLEDSIIRPVDEALPIIETHLTRWKVKGTVENFCFNSLSASILNIHVSIAVMKAGCNGYKHYKMAANCQFTDPVECIKQLNLIKHEFELIYPVMNSLLKVLKILQDLTGHTEEDSARLIGRRSDIKKIIQGIDRLINNVGSDSGFNFVPLPAWTKYISYCLTEDPEMLRGYLHSKLI